MSRLRVGIIGFGGAGIAHYSYFSCLPNCVVTKVYDTKSTGLERAKQIAGTATPFSDLCSFWGNLDAVSVCSPDSTHAYYVTRALEHGLHVLCEKPLTDSLEGIRQIQSAARRSDRVVAVLHQMRFLPLHRKIKDCLRKGELGEVSYLEGLYAHDLRERTFRYDDWRITDVTTPLVNSGCHFVDLLRWFTEDEIIEVTTVSNHLSFPEYPESDLNLAILRFASGAIGKVLVAFGAACPQDHSVRIYGADGVIENNVLFKRGGQWARTIYSPVLVHRKLQSDPVSGSRHSFYWQVRRNLRAYVIAKIFEVLRRSAGRTDRQYGIRHYPIRLYEHAAACVEAVEDFVAAVEEARRPLCTVDEAAKTVLVCLAGVESARENCTVQVRSLNEVAQEGDIR